MNRHQYSNKLILTIIIIFSIMSAIQRDYVYPKMSITLHVLYLVVFFLLLLIIWKFILKLGEILEKYLPIADRAGLRIFTQVILTFLFSIVFQYIVFNPVETYFKIERLEMVYVTATIFVLFRTIVFNLLYFGTYYFQEWKANLIRSEGLQKEQAEVRYNALRNQLNPHFLFNALTSLNSLIYENHDLASDFLKQLSKVYRYTLQHKEKETVSLKKEIEFVNHYISLLKTRFTSNIAFSVRIQESSLDREIVPVISQMLIENAIKHNIISPSHPLQISIYTDDSYLIVTNNLNRKSQIETSNRLGLENLKALYIYLSPLPIEVNETNGFYIIKIPLI